MRGLRVSGDPVVKHSTPRPSRAAFSNVLGFPAATHIGGCGSLNGFGRTLRGGSEKYLPWKLYSFSRHIFLNSGRTSSTIPLVSSGSVMPKPRCSVDDEPRPTP